MRFSKIFIYFIILVKKQRTTNRCQQDDNQLLWFPLTLERLHSSHIFQKYLRKLSISTCIPLTLLTTPEAWRQHDHERDYLMRHSRATHTGIIESRCFPALSLILNLKYKCNWFQLKRLKIYLVQDFPISILVITIIRYSIRKI